MRRLSSATMRSRIQRSQTSRSPATTHLTPAVGFLLWRRMFTGYRVLTAAAVGSLVLAWGLGQAPYLLGGKLTIAQAAAPTATHVVLLVVTAAVVLLVVPALGLLLYFDQRSAFESPKAD